VCVYCDQLIISGLFSSYAYSICIKCGDPLLNIDSTCMHHGRQEPVHIEKTGFYSSFLKELIIRYKFSPCRALSEYIASMVSVCLRSPDQPQRILWIVHVPCSVKGLQARGWDQMEVIADLLAQKPFTIKAPFLQRKNGSEQKLKTRERRMIEVGGAFTLNEQLLLSTQARLPAPDAVVVIDDVYTTGATMHECIKLLQTHFTCRVSGICLAMD